MMHNQMVKFPARELGRTEKGLKLSAQGFVFWVPLRMVHLSRNDNEFFVTMPERLARKKGLI